MAAPELTRGWSQTANLARQWVLVCGAMWSITMILAAAVMLAGAPAGSLVARVLGLALQPSATLSPTLVRALSLAAHNIPLAGWPLLLSYAGACRSRQAQLAADTLVGVAILANVLPVGAALGAYGTRLLPYIPQLPLEWAGLALGYTSWLVQRERPVTPRERVGLLVLMAGLLVAAALLETFAVPHR